jgi:OOP family OmpA-OmpF porin
MVKTALIAILIAAAAVASTAVQKFYAVGSVGRSSIDAEPGAINAFATSTVGASNTTNSSNDVGWKLQLGYEINTTWAVEGGYTNLGSADYITTNAAYTAKGQKKADLWNLDLVGKIPLGTSFSLLARIGGYRWQTKSDMPFVGGMQKVKDDGTDVKFGLGLQYDFNANFAVRGEFERFNGIGKSTTSGDSKVNLFSIGGVLKY